LTLALVARYDSFGRKSVKLTDKQKGVVRGVIPAAVSTLIGMCGVSLLIPMRALPTDEAGARLAWAMQWTLLPTLTLMVSIMRVANYRFASPDDIDGSGLTAGTDRVLVLRAILQNTLEQAVLAVAVYLIWIAVMPLSWLRAIPVAALLFMTGRVFFARGYDRGAAGRAMGFGLTAYPTFGMLATVTVVLLIRLAHWANG
jgi:hypothetical protein